MGACLKLSSSPEPAGGPLVRLYREYLAEVQEPAAAAILAIDAFHRDGTHAQSPAPRESEYLTAEAAADMLKVGYRTVLDLCKSGALKHKKVGRQIRILPADLEKIQQPQAKGRHFTL